MPGAQRISASGTSRLLNGRLRSAPGQRRGGLRAPSRGEAVGTRAASSSPGRAGPQDARTPRAGDADVSGARIARGRSVTTHRILVAVDGSDGARRALASGSAAPAGTVACRPGGRGAPAPRRRRTHTDDPRRDRAHRAGVPPVRRRRRRGPRVPRRGARELVRHDCPRPSEHALAPRASPRPRERRSRAARPRPRGVGGRVAGAEATSVLVVWEQI